jgi:hypothetical protein
MLERIQHPNLIDVKERREAGTCAQRRRIDSLRRARRIVQLHLA